MVQCFRVLIAHTEDLSSIPRTLIVAHNHLYAQLQRIYALF